MTSMQLKRYWQLLKLVRSVKSQLLNALSVGAFSITVIAVTLSVATVFGSRLTPAPTAAIVRLLMLAFGLWVVLLVALGILHIVEKVIESSHRTKRGEMFFSPRHRRNNTTK